jgi:hypothetical protein
MDGWSKETSRSHRRGCNGQGIVVEQNLFGIKNTYYIVEKCLKKIIMTSRRNAVSTVIYIRGHILKYV